MATRKQPPKSEKTDPAPSTRRRGRVRTWKAARQNFTVRILPEVIDALAEAVDRRQERTGEPMSLSDATEEALRAWVAQEGKRR